ncbi:hypothetical protein EDD16DRAFT_1489232 [Pisolithus croceorrhizus]|nr:hypothetical protein EV401DRAFT_1877862 [Pisolithus croceorrhizus]KAI6107209.1 hypothetical protein EDD16DRAFT_1489232 [Pisolithus croceorrhizus]KAI6143172.1 hypothetical protein EDD17DRAFT_1497479 [Pisolithus thermaeus]
MSAVSLSDNTLNINRSSYNGTSSEKPARGMLFTLVQRNLTRATIVAVDLLNHSKRSRHRVYCVDKEIKVECHYS